MIKKSIIFFTTFLLFSVNLHAEDNQIIKEPAEQPSEQMNILKIPIMPFKIILDDLEAMGNEVIDYSQSDISLKTIMKPELIYPVRVWHYPVDLTLASPKWITHYPSITGEKIMNRQLLADRNFFVSVPSSLVGGILYILGFGEVPAKWLGIILRDFAKLMKFEPFRKNENTVEE